MPVGSFFVAVQQPYSMSICIFCNCIRRGFLRRTLTNSDKRQQANGKATLSPVVTDPIKRKSLSPFPVFFFQLKSFRYLSFKSSIRDRLYILF